MRDTLAFEKVLSGRSAEKRTALIVFPVVVALALIIGLAGVSISRMSGLASQVQIAQRQVGEANKAVEERDRQLRDVKGDLAVLSTPGQGASVLHAAAENGASGIARIHPERHAIALYAYNLNPPAEGQEYRLIVSDAEGHEALLGTLSPDDRGAAALIARDVPEGASRLEVALVPTGGAPVRAAKPEGQAPGAEGETPVRRQPVLLGMLPKPGEAGVVTEGPEAPGQKLQARPPAAGRRRGR
jgi:hypothetical protein